MKITIYQNREVYKEESKIGNDSENKVETLEFEFPEEYEDFTKYIEFQIKGEKYVDLIEGNKYVITREVAKYGKIKTQVVLKKNTENDVMIFKSDVFTLTVSNSINATENLIYTVGVDLIEKIVTKNNEQDTRLNNLELDNTTNKENISNLQNDNTTNKTNIKSLQDDNEVNKTDISNIKQEQTIQNTNIQELQTDNTSNKAKILDLEAKNTEQDTSIQTNTESIEQLKEKDTTQDSLIEQLQTKVVNLEAENTSLKNQIPCGEATGNPIHLTDSSNLPCEIAVVGNSEQEKREGYNLLDISNIPSQTVKGITISDNGDGGIKISGTSEGAGTYDIQTNIILEGQYTLSVETKGTTSLSFQFLLRNANNANVMYVNNIASNSTKSQTLSNLNETITYLRIYFVENITFDCIIYPMLVSGSEVKPYEQYGASPSPDYPSEIVTVGQNGSVEISVDNGLETTDTNYQSYAKVLPIQKEFVKINDVEDTFIKQDGKWYEKHCIEKLILDGTESWEYNSTYSTFGTYGLFNDMESLSQLSSQSVTPVILSNFYKAITWKQMVAKEIGLSILLLSNGSNQTRLYSELTTVEDFKNWLAEKYTNGTPLIVYYILETPELIACTEEQSAILNSFYTYKGVTNISVDGIGKIKIIYKQDQQTINKNYENRLAALEAAAVS